MNVLSPSRLHPRKQLMLDVIRPQILKSYESSILSQNSPAVRTADPPQHQGSVLACPLGISVFRGNRSLARGKEALAGPQVQAPAAESKGFLLRNADP